MEVCSYWALVPTTDQLKTWLSILGSVVIAASIITSMTPTPAPGCRLARAYRVLELAALLFGRAKDTGLLPAATKTDQALKEAIELVKKQNP